MSQKIPCLMVAGSQAAGGIAAQFLGPQMYGGGVDWKSILASHGTGFAVGVLVNFLALYTGMSLFTPGDAIRQWGSPVYTLKSLVHVTTGIGVAVDQGLQWLASLIVLAMMRMNTRTFLLDVAASTVGQGIGGIGAAVAIQRHHPHHHAAMKRSPGQFVGDDQALITKVENQQKDKSFTVKEGVLTKALGGGGG